MRRGEKPPTSEILARFAGGIAHDFNNLLTVIRGSAEMLRGESLSAELRNRHADAIVETADSAAELTGKLLAFAQQQALQPRRTDLGVFLEGLRGSLAAELGPDIAIAIEAQPGLWPVEADPTQLEMLVRNAALNARDAMHGDGALTFEIRNVDEDSGGAVRLSVIDTGTGMNEQVLARAFEPFFSTKGPGLGTGLGLSQAYGFAAQSGGRLEISSELGHGTVLSLFLPRASAEVERIDLHRDDGPPGSLPQGTRILLVEDSRTVAVFAQSLLEDMGCEVMHAKDAEEALLAVEHEPREFDIVFSDIVMPGLSGLELAARIRERKPCLPILLATGYSEAAARGEGSEFPILPKPYKRESLSRKLSETMAASAALA